MELNIQIIIYLIIYFLFILSYSIFISRKQSQDDFLISSRKRNWFSIGMSKYATSVGAAWFISYTAYIYEFGFSVFSLVVGYIIAMCILAFYITPKLHNISKQKEFIKLGDIVYFKTKSNILAKISNIASSLIMFVWLVVIVIGGANMVSYFNILSYEFALITMLFIVLFYLYFIGYKGVVTTDILQSSIIVVVLMVISYYLFHQSDISELSKVEFNELSIGTVIGFLIYGIFSAFSFVDRYQILFSGRNEKNIKKGFMLVVPLILISVSLLLIVGYYVRSEIPNLDSSLVFLKAIELYLPQVLIPISIVMFFAAVMSSMDSYVYGVASQFHCLSKKSKVVNIRYNTFIIILLSLVIAYFFRDILNISVFAAGFSLILSVPMMYLFCGKDFINTQKTISRFLMSLIFSVLGLFVGIMIFGFTPTIALFPIVFGSLGLIFNISFFNKMLGEK